MSAMAASSAYASRCARGSTTVLSGSSRSGLNVQNRGMRSGTYHHAHGSAAPAACSATAASCVSVTPHQRVGAVRSTRVKYSSHCAAKKTHSAATSSHVPRWCAPSPISSTRLRAKTAATAASQPWSNSCPSGDALAVRRACLPSMASMVW